MPHDPVTRKMAPVILRDVTPDMAVMREEIFGPILPVMTVADEDAAIAHINAGPRPLPPIILAGTRRRDRALPRGRHRARWWWTM
jgi:acyl-CoA reductase-like NAD-dependent aldehyde dehydrogenase